MEYMATGSSFSGGSSGLGGAVIIQQKSGGGGSEEEVQVILKEIGLMDERKRKRMISNRESARRSRMRKQNHLDELMNQVDDLIKQNNQIISAINLTTQNYLNLEAYNSVLTAQLSELTHRLQSLNQIIDGGGFSGNFEDQPFSSSSSSFGGYAAVGGFGGGGDQPFLYDPLANHLQPFMPSADLLQY